VVYLSFFGYTVEVVGSVITKTEKAVLEKNKTPVVSLFPFLYSRSGAGSEAGPSYLLQEDVVLVTINYRLGILGTCV
jgi:hypothetical protein